ncbi:hypothetical protein ACT3CE_01350 [Marinifilum sp. RC60d5]|uniref:hypothetical protein n=1 Tax=Marinifilum sp. RC60d5 TaxID=3458414 RepID=UPI004035426A
MKRLKNIFSIIILSLFFVACGKVEAEKDVTNCINKLNRFNNLYSTLSVDGVISKEKVGEEDSEFDQLKKVASEYYELVNKINSDIQEEKEKAEKGKKIKGYEKKYQEVLKAKHSEIEKATKLFEDNLSKL